MKIMQISTEIVNESSGPSYSVPSLCTALQNNGCDVTLYTLEKPKNKKFNFKIKSFSKNFFPHPRLGRSPLMYKTMLEDAPDFDVIHSHMLWMSPNYYPGIIAKKLGKPFICSPRGTLSKWALAQSKWKKRLILAFGQKKALDAVTCFHATAKSEAKEIQNYGYKDIPITIIPNGIDIPALKPKKITAIKHLVFLSRIHPKKGIENLIEAWGQIEKDFLDWDLTIAGPNDNNYAKKLMKHIDNNSIKRVKFVGEIKGDKKIDFLRDSHLFVLPTFSENFGIVIAEALACELPVICTKGAPWSGLNEHRCGWWIDIGIEPLKKSLQQAMSLSKSQHMQMGKNGRRWMQEKFTWDAIAKDMIKTYKWILGLNKKPSCVKEPKGST